MVVHFLKAIHLLDLQGLVVFTNLTIAVFEGDGRMEQGFEFHKTVWQSTLVIIKLSPSSVQALVFLPLLVLFTHHSQSFCCLACSWSL